MQYAITHNSAKKRSIYANKWLSYSQYELQHCIAAAAASTAEFSARVHDRQCYSRRHLIQQGQPCTSMTPPTVFRIMNIRCLPAPITAKITAQTYSTHRLAVYCGSEILSKIKISVVTRVYLVKSNQHKNEIS